MPIKDIHMFSLERRKFHEKTGQLNTFKQPFYLNITISVMLDLFYLMQKELSFEVDLYHLYSSPLKCSSYLTDLVSPDSPNADKKFASGKH